MCTILIAYKIHPKYPFVFLENRDEFKSRDTVTGQYYEDVFMGKDLEKGGTWMGFNTNGRFCCLTNYRDMTDDHEYKTSRGELTLNWLKGVDSTFKYVAQLKKDKEQYKGYNLIFGYFDELYYYSNVANTLELLKPGIYGLSNHFLNTPWPKVSIGKQSLGHMMDVEELDVNLLFHILNPINTASDDQLPETGLSIDNEKALSAMHVNLDNYGTVVKQVMTVDDQLRGVYYERNIKDNFQKTWTTNVNLRR